MRVPVSTSEHLSYCRLCFNACSIRVRVVDGKVESVSGDPDSPLYQGYSCVKGRLQPVLLRDRSRLLTSMKRDDEGIFKPISSALAMDEVAAKLRTILDRFGPDAIAFYFGTMAASNSATVAVFDGFADAVGSQMRFTPATVDKAGKNVAAALTGVGWRRRKATPTLM